MKKILVLIILFTFFGNRIKAEEFDIENDEVIVSGETIGINLDLGVIVTGTYGIREDEKLVTPWKDVIKEGDKIIEFNNKKITTLEDLQAEMLNSKKSTVTIKFIRDDKIYESKITPALKNDGTYSLGIYIKDKIIGIGTLTCIIPGINKYAALGHSINTADFSKGVLSKAEVVRIKKATKNSVGEKHAVIKYPSIGSVDKNLDTGIYGDITEFRTTNMMKVAKQEDVKLGKAYILTSIEKNKVEKFEVEIIKKYKQDKTEIKSMKIKITDQRLIDETGGIIQGMSGSPIIQDDKIIGALTHVIINNPTEGYGIYIEWMLKDLGLTLK